MDFIKRLTIEEEMGTYHFTWELQNFCTHSYQFVERLACMVASPYEHAPYKGCLDVTFTET